MYQIQLLRGIACLFVCLNHFKIFNKSGFGAGGVEIFFILSGYLTLKNYIKKGKKLEENYLLKKIITILPLYWLLTIFIYIVGNIKPSLFTTMQFEWKNLIYSLFLIPGKTMYVYPGWTLTYMFYFYIIFYLCDKIFKNKIAHIYCTIYFVIAFIVSHTIITDKLIQLYNSPMMLEFLLGFFLVYIEEKIKIRDELVYCIIPLLCILFFLPGFLFEYRYIIPAFLASCIILLCNKIKLDSDKNLFVQIGNISYVIYLIHPLIIRPIDKIIDNFRVHNLIITFLGILSSLLLVIVLSKLINDNIQKKIIGLYYKYNKR